MLKIKVCGMREESNISELIKIMPDFIGLIFHENSPRNITNDQLFDIPSEIKKVGVFVDETQEFILDKVKKFQLDYIQLHGKESPLFCHKMKDLNIKVIKAFNIYSDFNFTHLRGYTTCCDYFLFDAFGKNSGGNGIVFDWKLLDKYTSEIPFLLSGGIDANMVKEIKNMNHSMFVGVDVNSKFEIEAGVKDIEKIKKFKDEIQG